MTSTREDSQPSQPLGLVWAIKRSFVEYVRRMSDGKGWIGDRAVPFSDDRIFFTYDADASRPGAWSFQGDVRFSGHFGMLFVRLANPTVTLVDGRASLTIEESSETARADRLELVTMRLDLMETVGGVEYWYGTDAVLAAGGVELFNNVYAVGEPFEPLVLVVPAELTDP
ncbi:HtaA domain-containing protein [Jatrophihabitans sp.]|uniref:HtaA domain-containing protein n=1 Tax=Jatrophihabitans sp. TaxID=1932789 RepID=UPI0030C7566B